MLTESTYKCQSSAMAKGLGAVGVMAEEHVHEFSCGLARSTLTINDPCAFQRKTPTRQQSTEGMLVTRQLRAHLAVELATRTAHYTTNAVRREATAVLRCHCGASRTNCRRVHPQADELGRCVSFKQPLLSAKPGYFCGSCNMGCGPNQDVAIPQSGPSHRPGTEFQMLWAWVC